LWRSYLENLSGAHAHKWVGHIRTIATHHFFRVDTACVIHDESGKQIVLIYQLFKSLGQEHGVFYVVNYTSYELQQQQQEEKKNFSFISIKWRLSLKIHCSRRADGMFLRK
jgi:hypothetical protein